MTVEEGTSQVVVVRENKVDPYHNETPSSILTRQYLVLRTSLSTDVVALMPFETLLANTTVQNYLKRFKFFRGGVKLKFLLLTNSMQYGTIAISFLPYYNTTNWLTTAQRSQADMHLLDISEQNSFELTLPWYDPANFCAVAGTDPKHWVVFIDPLFIGTITSETTTTVTMEVFASFEEPEAIGYMQAMQIERGNRRGISSAARLAKYAAPIVTTALGAAAGNAASSFASMAGSFSSGEPNSEAETSVKLGMAEDLSNPHNPESNTNSTKLGDNTKVLPSGQHPNSPTSISEIVRRPTLVERFVLNNEAETRILDTDLFNNPTYVAYFAQMFRYFRGSTKICLHFVTSPLVSLRLQITLYPVTPDPVAAGNDIGDLPSWIISVKGTENFVLEIPYLQYTPWSFSDGTGLINPALSISLLDTVPQPFDVPVGVYVISFLSAGDDFQFASLESVVPQNTVIPEFGVMQSRVFDIMQQNVIKFPPTFPAPFQGGIDDIYSCMKRFSTRQPSGTPVFFPSYPIVLTGFSTGVSPAYMNDNFDWIANIFKFFSGNCNVKTVFNGTSSTGYLRANMQNSKVVSGGANFVGGNSMALTAQAVWPMLEVEMPYINRYEFNSIWEPLAGPYDLDIEFPSDVQSYYISAGQHFRLHYLLPLPDWFVEAVPRTQNSVRRRVNPNHVDVDMDQLVEKLNGRDFKPKRSLLSDTVTPANFIRKRNQKLRGLNQARDNIPSDTGIMQSAPRMSGNATFQFTNLGLVGTGTQFCSVATPSLGAAIGTYFVSIFKASVAVEGVISPGNSRIFYYWVFNNGPGTPGSLTWLTDIAGAGQIVYDNQVDNVVFFSESKIATNNLNSTGIFYIYFWTPTPILSGESYSFSGNLTLVPFSDSVINNDLNPVPVVASSPLPVTTTETLSVSVTNTPGVFVNNALDQAVPVTIINSSPIAFTGQVEGIPGSTTPVWTTGYKN